MGVDLVRRRDSKKWACNNALWRFIINSAKSEHWKPLGTRPAKSNEEVHDPTDYLSNNSQIVTPEDAENMCLSLEKFGKQNELSKVEREIIESFLKWSKRTDENDVLIDIPGFIIR